MAKEKKKGYDWSGASHPKYDVSEGFGNSTNWRRAFKYRMNWDEAVQVVAEANDTPHGILGVEFSATMEVIKSAFRKLSQIWHPDKFQAQKETNPEKYSEAEKMFKKINAAYRILCGKN